MGRGVGEGGVREEGGVGEGGGVCCWCTLRWMVGVEGGGEGGGWGG
jgi:hypothetical protein